MATEAAFVHIRDPRLSLGSHFVSVLIPRFQNGSSYFRFFDQFVSFGKLRSICLPPEVCRMTCEISLITQKDTFKCENEGENLPNFHAFTRIYKEVR